MRILTVIQARTGSTRFPKKVMKALGHGTVLSTQIERITAAQLKGQIVVATTTEPDDDLITDYCHSRNIAVIRGHPTDLLDRHYQAMLHYNADVVVKIPSDCPLIAPNVIDRVLNFYLSDPDRYDYVSNLHPQSYPDGNDVEVIRSTSLAVAWKEAKRTIEREHTTPFFWDNPERFSIGNVLWETGLDLSLSYRFTLDYIEDYEHIVQIWNGLGPDNPLFGIEAILEYLTCHPDIYAINAAHLGDAWYYRHQHELKTLRSQNA